MARLEKRVKRASDEGEGGHLARRRSPTSSGTPRNETADARFELSVLLSLSHCCGSAFNSLAPTSNSSVAPKRIVNTPSSTLPALRGE